MAAVKQLGSDIFLLLDDTAIECTTEVSMEASAEEIDVSCKNTNGDSDFLPGQKTRTYNVSGIYTDGDTSNKDFNDLEVAFEAGTEFTALFGGVDTGDATWEQTVVITNISLNSGGNQSATTWSATLKGKGARTAGVVA